MAKVFQWIGIVASIALGGVLAYAAIVYLPITEKKQKAEGTYPLRYYAVFDNVRGLEQGSTVYSAGVPIGTVSKIQLHKGKAQVELRLQEGVQIYREDRVALEPSGLMGGMSIMIYGKPDEAKRLAPGGVLTRTTSGGGVLDLVHTLSTLLNTLRPMAPELKTFLQETNFLLEGLNKELKKDPKAAQALFRRVSRIVAETYWFLNSARVYFQKNRDEIAAILKNVRALTNNRQMQRLLPEVQQFLRHINRNMDDLLPALQQLLQNVNQSMKELSKQGPVLGQLLVIVRRLLLRVSQITEKDILKLLQTEGIFVRVLGPSPKAQKRVKRLESGSQ